jgi:hypothetical protein
VSYRHKAYSRLDAPEVEVFHDGAWCPGTLHEWRQDHRGGPWHGWVRYHVAAGDNRIGTFHQAQVRLHDPGEPGALALTEAGPAPW